MPKNLRVADVMTKDPLVVNEEDNLERIQEGMDSFHFRHIPVVDGERLVGLISQRDILRFAVSGLDSAAPARQRDSWIQEHTFVAEIMQRDVVTATPDTPLAEAARAMLEGRVGSLPVVEEGNRLVGIVTETDMLGVLVKLLEE
jgi:CBS domain-containing protein